MSDQPKPIEEVQAEMADDMDRHLARLTKAGTMRTMSPNGNVEEVDLTPSMWGQIIKRVKDLNLVPSHLAGTNAEKLRNAAKQRNLKLAGTEADLPAPSDDELDAATGT